MKLLYELGRHVCSGGVEPNAKSLAHAINFIRELEHYLRYEFVPRAYVTTDDDGDIDFEWRNGDKELSITIVEDGGPNYYLKSWDANGMEDGDLYYDDLIDLFSWLDGDEI